MISKSAIIVIIKLLTGGLQYVVFKMLLHYHCDDGTGTVKEFNKNYFLGVVTFFAMLLLVIPYFYAEVRDHNASRKLAGLPPSYPYGTRAHLLTVFPALLEVVGVLLSFEANKKLGATTMLLLKSLRIPVSAVMTKFFVGRSQRAYQWLAVAITIMGLVPVGMAESAESKKESGPVDVRALISVGLIVICEFLKGIRYVYEEKLIKIEKISSEFLVFMESVIGLVVAIIVMIAVNYIPLGENGGPKESLAETWAMLYGSTAIQVLLAINIVLVGVHNYSTTLITQYTSSVFNVLISQFRALVTFIASVLVHYCYDPLFGEEFTVYTPLKFVGYVMFIVAALLYNGNVRAPCDSCYPIDERSHASNEVEVKSRSTSEGGDKKEAVELMVV